MLIPLLLSPSPAVLGIEAGGAVVVRFDVAIVEGDDVFEVAPDNVDPSHDDKAAADLPPDDDLLLLLLSLSILFCCLPCLSLLV